ncbi:hypothetical protein BST91_03230 [Nonlabens tegetincola]|uniref:tetratricopeptide repeat protein n=1 Tax=Nonlabens tegetincola TaxID=323273 RepID=UPI000A202DE3|nr:tetratricopeptide repeat protein [Nonlabens tegetincola]ARN70728.1 hypothetical protein BST91_03230 [Nonlabens tegetincola]
MSIFLRSLIFLFVIFISCNSKHSYNEDVKRIFIKNLQDYNVGNHNLIKYNDSCLENNLIYDLDSSIVKQHYLRAGEVFYKSGNLNKSRTSLKKSLKYKSEITLLDDYKAIKLLFEIYNSKDNYAESLAMIKTFSEIRYDDTSLHSYYVNSLYQIVYTRLNELNIALSYNNKAYLNALEIKNEYFKVNTLIHKNNILQLRKDYKSASVIIDSLLISNNNISKTERASLLGDLGVIKFFQGDYDDAINNYKRSLEIYKESNTIESIENKAIQYANIAEGYLRKKSYDMTRVYLDSFYKLNQIHISNRIRKNVLKYEIALAGRNKINVDHINTVVDENIAIQNKFYKEKINRELNALQKEKEQKQALLLAKKIWKLII